jgi:hypothetical protein
MFKNHIYSKSGLGFIAAATYAFDLMKIPLDMHHHAPFILYGLNKNTFKDR